MIAIHLSKNTLYSCPTVLVLSMLFSSVRTSYAFEAAQSRARRSDRKYNAELVASLGASFSARVEAGDGQADDGFDGTHVVYPVCLFLSGSVQMGQHFAGRLTGGLDILVDRPTGFVAADRLPARVRPEIRELLWVMGA